MCYLGTEPPSHAPPAEAASRNDLDYQVGAGRGLLGGGQGGGSCLAWWVWRGGSHGARRVGAGQPQGQVKAPGSAAPSGRPEGSWSALEVEWRPLGALSGWVGCLEPRLAHWLAPAGWLQAMDQELKQLLGQVRAAGGLGAGLADAAAAGKKGRDGVVTIRAMVGSCRLPTPSCMHPGQRTSQSSSALLMLGPCQHRQACYSNAAPQCKRVRPCNACSALPTGADGHAWPAQVPPALADAASASSPRSDGAHDPGGAASRPRQLTITLACSHLGAGPLQDVLLSVQPPAPLRLAGDSDEWLLLPAVPGAGGGGGGRSSGAGVASVTLEVGQPGQPLASSCTAQVVGVYSLDGGRQQCTQAQVALPLCCFAQVGPRGGGGGDTGRRKMRCCSLLVAGPTTAAPGWCGWA